MDKHTFIHKIYSFMHEIRVFSKANHCIYIFDLRRIKNSSAKPCGEKINVFFGYYLKPQNNISHAFVRIFNNYFPKSSCKICNFVISFYISVHWGISLENFSSDQKNLNVRVRYFHSSFYVHLHARYER